jgi:hypothetical protein
VLTCNRSHSRSHHAGEYQLIIEIEKQTAWNKLHYTGLAYHDTAWSRVCPSVQAAADWVINIHGVDAHVTAFGLSH